MSRLENRAAPLVKRLAGGEEGVVIANSDRVVLAAWCQLKAMCWDRVVGDSRILDEMVQAFGMVVAPAHAVVLGGRVESASPAHIGFVRHVGTGNDVVEFVIHFDQFIAVVRFVVSGAMPVELLGSAPTDAFIGLWPPNAFPSVTTPTWPCPKVWEFNELLTFMTEQASS